MRSELAQLKGVVEGMKSYKDQATWWEKNAKELTSQLDAASRQLKESEAKALRAEQRAHMEWQRAEALLERKETVVDEMVRTRSGWEEEKDRFLERLSMKEQEMIALKHALDQRQSERDVVLEKYRHCLDQLDAAKAEFEQHVGSLRRQGQNGDSAAVLRDSNMYMLLLINTLKSALSQTELVNENMHKEREREREAEDSKRRALEDAVYRLSQQLEQERRLHAGREEMHTLELAKFAELLEQEVLSTADEDHVPSSAGILPESGDRLQQGRARIQSDVEQQPFREELDAARQEGAVWEKQAHMLRTQVNALRAELDIVRLEGEGLRHQIGALSKDADRLRDNGDHWHNEAIRAYSELAALARQSQSVFNLSDWSAPVESSPKSAREKKQTRNQEASLPMGTEKTAHVAPSKHDDTHDDDEQAQQVHTQTHTQTARYGDTSPSMMETMQQDLVLEKKARNDQCAEFDAIIKKLVDERDSLRKQVSRLSGEISEYALASKEAHDHRHKLTEEQNNLNNQVSRLSADLAEVSQVTKETHTLSHKLEELQRQLHSVTAENGTLHGENSILRSDVETRRKDQESLRAGNHTLTFDKETLRRENEKLRLDVHKLQEDVERMHNQLQTGHEQRLEAHAQHQKEVRVLTDKIQELSSFLDKSQHDVYDLTAQCESLRSQLSAPGANERDAQEKELVALKQDFSKHKDGTSRCEVTDCQNSPAGLKGQNGMLQGQNKELQGQVKVLSLESESLRGELDASKNELNASKNDKEKLQAEVQHLAGQISSTQNQNEQYGEHVHQLATERDALRNELAVIQCNRKQLEDDARQVRAECDSLRNELIALAAREEDASRLKMEIQQTVTDLILEKKARVEDAQFFNRELEQLKNEVVRLNCQLMHGDSEVADNDHVTMDMNMLEW